MAAATLRIAGQRRTDAMLEAIRSADDARVRVAGTNGTMWVSVSTAEAERLVLGDSEHRFGFRKRCAGDSTGLMCYSNRMNSSRSHDTTNPKHPFAHYSPTPTPLDLTRTYTQPQHPTYKPHGLWLADEQPLDDYTWPEWCQYNDYQTRNLTHRQPVHVNLNRILQIRHPFDLKHCFQPTDQTDNIDDLADARIAINWTLLTREHAGVWLRQSAYHGTRPVFWQIIDVDSLCVWDLTAVTIPHSHNHLAA